MESLEERTAALDERETRVSAAEKAVQLAEHAERVHKDLRRFESKRKEGGRAARRSKRGRRRGGRFACREAQKKAELSLARGIESQHEVSAQLEKRSVGPTLTTAQMLSASVNRRRTSAVFPTSSSLSSAASSDRATELTRGAAVVGVCQARHGGSVVEPEIVPGPAAKHRRA